MGIFSFITAPFSAVAGVIGGVITAGKRKKTAQINAANATKQRAHELKMAQMAQSQSKGMSTKTMLMIGGGGLGLIALIFFMKKR